MGREDGRTERLCCWDEECKVSYRECRAVLDMGEVREASVRCRVE